MDKEKQRKQRESLDAMLRYLKENGLTFFCSALEEMTRTGRLDDTEKRILEFRPTCLA